MFAFSPQTSLVIVGTTHGASTGPMDKTVKHISAHVEHLRTTCVNSLHPNTQILVTRSSRALTSSWRPWTRSPRPSSSLVTSTRSGISAPSITMYLLLTGALFAAGVTARVCSNGAAGSQTTFQICRSAARASTWTLKMSDEISAYGWLIYIYIYMLTLIL